MQRLASRQIRVYNTQAHESRALVCVHTPKIEGQSRTRSRSPKADEDRRQVRLAPMTKQLPLPLARVHNECTIKDRAVTSASRRIDIAIRPPSWRANLFPRKSSSRLLPVAQWDDRLRFILARALPAWLLAIAPRVAPVSVSSV